MQCAVVSNALLSPSSTSLSCCGDLKRSPRYESIRDIVKSMIRRYPVDALRPAPIESLHRGDWVKLICGASFEDAADVRNLSLVYALAGVDCIDCAADEAVVKSVNDGIDKAVEIASVDRPWVMISVNDDIEDIHFRKAAFDPGDCPPDCSRPCEKVCPANAILLEELSTGDQSPCNSNASSKLQGGVVTERCYGCGRCFPVCPYDKIRAKAYIRDSSSTCELLKRDYVDAIEIHTTGRRIDLFEELWHSLGNSINRVKLVAVSLPDMGNSTFTTMNTMYSIMKSRRGYNLWQLDGRPMSGDIGRGATREAISFAVRLAGMKERPHGFYQLAGGTNSHTIDGLKKLGLFQAMSHGKSSVDDDDDSEKAIIGGIAYGGYARKIVGQVLDKLPTQQNCVLIEDYPEYLMEALTKALTLVGPVKSYKTTIVSF